MHKNYLFHKLKRSNKTAIFKLLLLVTCSLIFNSNLLAQQTVYHINSSGTNLWWSGGNSPWYYQTWNNNQDRPDRTWQTPNDVFFGHNDQLTMDANGNDWYHIRQLTFQSAANQSRTISNSGSAGISIRGTGATRKIENLSSAKHILNIPIGFDAGDSEINPTSGDLELQKALYLYTNSLYVYGTNSKMLTIGGVISGTGSNSKVVLKQYSKLLLTNANTYTGNTEIDEGEIWIGNGGDISSSSAIWIGNTSLMSKVCKLFLSKSDGGQTFSRNLNINNGNTDTRFVGSLNSSGTNTLSGNIVRSGNEPLSIEVPETGGTFSITGIINGSGEIKKVGGGTLTLGGANTYDANTRVNAGTLTVASGGNLGSGTNTNVYISSGATVNINTNTTVASIQETANSNGGVIAIGNGATLTVNGNNKGTMFQNSISGAGGLTMAGSGTSNLSLYGTQSYTGATTVSGGALSIPVATSTSGITVSGGTLNLNHDDAAGSGTLTINSGTVNVNAAKNISNAMSIGGDFTFTGTANLTQGTGAITLTASPTVTISANTLTLGGIISGSFGFTKNGNGSMVLTGANDYTGSTSVSAGTLQLNRSGGNTLPATNNVTVNGGTLKVSTNQTLNNLSVTSGTLVIDAGVTLTINGTYTGGGTITNNGSIVLNTTSFPGSSSTISSMNNLTINRSLGVVTLDKDLTLTGTLTLTSGTMDIGNNTLTINSNSISITSGDIDADNGTLVFTNSSILTVPASTIKSGTIKNLTINGAGIILSNGTTVSGALSLSSGTLDLGNTTLTYSGSNITRSSGDIDADAGNLEFANASAITLPASVIKTGTIANLTMNGAGGVSLGQNITISTSVALSSGILSLGNYNLTMNGTFSGSPGSTCYIKTDGSGSVTKNSMAVSSTPFTFPVGNSAFNKLTITNQTSAADNFGVRVIDEVYDNGTGASGATVLSTKPRVKRTWQITKGTGSSNSSNGVDIGFYWESSHESSPAPVSYTVFHHNGTKWQEITTPSAAGTNFTVISGYKGSFSPFAVGDNVTPLPVTWLYNRCETTKSGTGIEWGTAEEKDVKTFTIEKSSSGQLFVPIGSIAGSGNSHTPRHYRFEDKNPNPEGAYYRIKQTDQTGEESYSKTCFANSIKNAPSAIISTTDNEVLITTGNADSETSRYVVYNTAGKIMLKGQFTGSQARIPIGHLMVGFYEITIQSASGNHAQKLLINPK